jgi:acetyl/propionyl-CoA carboxylase alpha subunit
VASRNRPARFTAIVGDASHAVEVTPLDDGRWEVAVDGRTHVVDSRQTGAATFSLLIDHATAEVSVLVRGDRYAVETGGRTHRIRLLDERAMRARGRAAGDGDREVRAVMPGKVTAVLVEVGAVVEAGQALLVIEAMKMENEVVAHHGGVVESVEVEAGEQVANGQTLLQFAE